MYCYKTFCEKKEFLLPTEKGQSKLSPSDIIYAEYWERGSRLQLTSGPIAPPCGDLFDNFKPQPVFRRGLPLNMFQR